MAVADDQVPGRYLVGIECDGASYHSARSARERDRLRQAVLEDHGWNIHRIWSSDWFQRPKAELERLIETIERAKADAIAGGNGPAARKRAVPVEVVTIDRADVTEIGLQEVGSTVDVNTPYEEVSLYVNASSELHEAPLSVIGSLVKNTVKTESPVHSGEVITRIRTAWGLQRAGGRIEAHVNQAIKLLVDRSEVVRSGEFLLEPDSEIRLRDRSAVSSPGLRRLELLPPMEIDHGLKTIIDQSLGGTEEQAINAVARGLGFKSTSAQLREIIRGRIEVLVKRGELEMRDGMLVAVQKNLAG